MSKCKECGCTKVQTKMWVEVNTDKVIDKVGSEKGDVEDNWCPDCTEHCEIITK